MSKHMFRRSQSSQSGCVRANLKRSMVTLTALVPLLMITGCASFSKKHFTVGSVQDSYKSRHPIVLDEREQTLDIPVATNSYALPLAQKGAIEGFAGNFKKSATGVIVILLPKGSPNASSAHRMGEKVIDTLASSGVPYERIRKARYDASKHGPSAPIRLSYVAVAASVEECGKWPEDLAGANLQNKNYHNFGCANQNNLASMIANPSDLVAPRGMSDIDAQRRNEVIKDYRDGNTRLGKDLKSDL